MYKSVLILLAATCVTACGGGGGPATPASATQGTDTKATPNGTIVDSDNHRINRYSIEFHSNGNIKTVTYTNDAGKDGDTDASATISFNEAGLPTKAEGDSQYDTDGNVDQVFVWQYDSGNRLTRFSKDTNADGAEDWIRTYTYDAAGNNLTDSTDSDANGANNSIETSTYNAANKRTQWSQDNDGDGSANLIYKYFYDASNFLTSFEQDTDADGNTDNRTTYTNNAAGQWIQSDYDGDLDSVIDNTTTRQFDADGNQTEYVGGTTKSVYTYVNGQKTKDETFRVAGNVLERTNTYTYHSNGQRKTYSIDNDSDGNLNSLYEYDEMGNLIRVSKSSADDGNYDDVQTITYENISIKVELTDIDMDFVNTSPCSKRCPI